MRLLDVYKIMLVPIIVSTFVHYQPLFIFNSVVMGILAVLVAGVSLATLTINKETFRHILRKSYYKDFMLKVQGIYLIGMLASSFVIDSHTLSFSLILLLISTIVLDINIERVLNER